MTQVQQNNIQDLDDLAAQVEELVGELSEACEKVSKRLSDEGSEEEDAAPEDRSETAEPGEATASADAKTDDAAEAPGEAGNAPAGVEPHPAEAALDDLEQQLDGLIEAGSRAETDEAPPNTSRGPGAQGDSVEAGDAMVADAPTGSTIDAEDIDDLDQQIADLTDELLDGDFVDAEGASVGEGEALASTQRRASDGPADTAQPEPEPSSQASVDDAETTPAAPETVAKAAADTESEDESQTDASSEAPAPKPSPAPRAAARAAPTAEQGTNGFVAVLLLVVSKADTGARTLADLMATPLKNRPKIVRDTIGWFGLWTLFLAVCVWITLAFFRSPEHPEAEGEPMRIRTAEESSTPRPANQRPLPQAEAVRSAASPR